MSFNRYYQDELAYLRELGREFSDANPKLAPFLAERGSDPDVERLLEGFAFLSGRLRQKLDDDLPELTHSLVALLWPHYLRPVPSMSVLQFRPTINAVTESKHIPRGVEVDSIPVAGTSCRFRTCYDVEIHPLAIDRVTLRKDGRGSVLELEFLLHTGASLEKLALKNLRLHLHGDPYHSRTLYLWMNRYLQGITVRAAGETQGAPEFNLNPDNLQPAGFADEEALLPYPPTVFLGYRLIQEYYGLPEKFLFLDLKGLDPLVTFGKMTERFVVSFEFSRPMEDAVRVREDNIRLFCTPIVNLFSRDADPIRVDQTKVEYRVRPSGRDSAHLETYSIDHVEGWLSGSKEKRKRVYSAFESYDHRPEDNPMDPRIYYRTRLHPAVVGRSVETNISFVSQDESHTVPRTETISLQLTCSNRNLPEKLKVGDVRVATDSSPEFCTFRNIIPANPSISPPLGAGLHWNLISNMALNYVSLASVDALRSILYTYDFRIHYDRQAERESRQRLDGLVDARVEPVDLLHKGMPIRGLRTYLDMRESNFAGEGDMYLMASVLNVFFALFASVNSFHQLVVRGVEHGEIYRWSTRIGQQPLL
ncbi:MAG: type VI secretion system baseplate subunit TssF [Candidatus Thiodiazotropha sp.]